MLADLMFTTWMVTQSFWKKLHKQRHKLKVAEEKEGEEGEEWEEEQGKEEKVIKKVAAKVVLKVIGERL